MINDYLPEESDANESFEEVGDIDLSIISGAALSGTDWTAETIINQIIKGNIQLNPKFQRRDAWDDGRKSRFIESLFLGLPIPQLVLAEVVDKKGSYIVIDGKQRLLSLRQFISEKNDKDFNQLRLKGLTIRKDLNGKTFEQIRKDIILYADISSFENQTIRTVVIRNWKRENLLYAIFLRLNTGSVSLSPQELRQALKPGKFVDFVDVESGDSKGLKLILKISKPDFRMRDAELLIRYYAYINFISLYTGNLKNFLDETCASFNKHWDSREDSIKTQLVEFENAIQAAITIFGKENIFRKWLGTNYQNNFNRAIFDIMIFYLSDSAVRKSMLEKADEVEKLFRDLCVNNIVFLTSILTTTKSIGATYNRLSIWGSNLRDIGIDVRVPKLIGDRIKFD